MRRLLLSFAALALVLAACGSDDGSIDPEAGGEDPDIQADLDPETDSELKTAVESYARTQLQGDPDATNELRSNRCLDVATELEADGGQGVADDDISVATYEADIDGDEARVNYRFEDPAPFEGTDERWVKEDGVWKWDNC